MANQPKNKTVSAQFISDKRWLIMGLSFLILLYLLSPVLTPFIVAALIAYICDPLVDRLSQYGTKTYKIGRSVATIMALIIIFTVISGLFLILIPLLQKQSLLIAERLPVLIDHLRAQIEPWLLARFDISLAIDGTQIQHLITDNWKTTGGIIGDILKSAGTKGLALIGVVSNLLLLPVVLFYLLRDWDGLIGSIRELIPRDWVQDISDFAKEIDQVVAQFLRGQLSVMLALCIFYSIGLWLAGLDMALSIGLIAGLLSFIPYLGFALAFIIAVILALLQFSTLSEVIPVLMVFGIGQFVESFIFTPYLVGDRIGLHPVVVILALLAAGQLFGFAGVLLALPVSAAIAVGLKRLKKSYLKSETYLN